MYYPRREKLFRRTRHAILVRAHDGEWARIRIDAGLRCVRLG
ncbi:hypothetical protein [Paenibacillus odorifer]|nr:hypothetical protein [Paenibacillus odorifer]